MATNFDFKSTNKGYVPFPQDTPLDIRTVVETFDDIPSIPNPFLGMQVFVKDSNELYLVKKIDERVVGKGTESFINTTDEHALARMVNSDNIDSIVGPIEGVAYLTSYVFTRATSKPSKPNGGLFTKPYPTIESDGETIKDPNWHDTVPSTGVGAIYMSYCTFCSDPSKNGEGTDPSKLSDSSDFQVEFTARDLSAIPQYKPSKFTGNQNEWRQQELNGEYQVVGGDDTITDIKYMATAVSHDGVWEDGTVIKIKGEKGDKGDQGEGAKISLKGKFGSLDALMTEWNLYRNDIESYPPNTEGPHFLLPLEIGDGYIVDENGHLYVYSGDDSDFNSCWTDAGVIKGDSAYLYIRYSNNADGEGFWDPGVNNTPGRYIGTKTSTYPLNPDDLTKKETFTGTLWRGEDGWGYEQVFLLTHKTKGGYSENNGPNVPNMSEHVPDYLPPHGLNQNNVMGANDNTTWADRPLTTSETGPLCWVVTRKAGKEYSAWKGDVNTGKATLYSKYVTDGIPGTSPFFLELSNDQAVLPLENGTIDPGFEGEISTELYLYEGNNPITNNIEYSIDPSDVGTFTNNKVVFNKSKLNDISEVICTAKYPVINGNNTNAKPYSRKFRITKTNNAYEIVPSTHVLVRDEYGDISSTTNLSVEVKKGDSAENVWKVPSDKYLGITYYYVSGEPTTTNTSITNNIPIDLDKENLTAIKFYITDDNTKDGTELSYEQIGVIANVNGDNGDTYKTVYAFTRCDDAAIANAEPSGGNGDSAKPEETTVNNVPYEGHDTVPDGTGAIWVTTRQFMGGNNNFGSGSNPKKMSDTADFEVEFSAGKMKEDGTLDVETKPSLKSLQNFTSIGTGKADEQHKDWNGADDVPGAVGMATAVKHGSTGSDWSVVRIKGEKGERGANGTSVKILGTGKIVETFPETQLTWDDGRENNNVEYILYKNKTSETTYKYIIYKGNGSEYAELENNENGDGYIFEGDLGTGDGDSWENVGKVQGPAGSSAYLYVRCSDTEGTSKVLKDEGETGKYIGYYASTEPKTKDELQRLSTNNKFVGAKGSGEDGGGGEQIYLLTTTAYAWDKGPDISRLSNEKNVDYLPDHGLNTDELIVAKGDASNTAKGSDIPLVPTEEFPYCWETRRKVQGPIVAGKGSNIGEGIKDNNGCAILYDRYVTNGKNAVHLELSNDFATVPVDKNGTVDPDFILAENIFTELQLYEGGKKVENGVKYDVVPSSDNSYTASCENNKITVTKINEDYVFVQCKAEYNDTDYFKNFRVQKREEAGRLKLTGTNVIKKSYDAQSNLTITSGTIGFEVEKGNDVKGDRVENKLVFVEYVLNGETITVKVTNGGYNFNSVDASATNFRVYITDNDRPLSEGSTMLDQEGLGVVSDGINGKDTYSIELTNDVGTIPLEPNGQIDTQAGDVTTSIQMLKGNVVITKQDDVTYEMNVEASNAIQLTDEGVLTIYPKQFTSTSDIPQSIELSATHGNVTLKKVFRINVSQNAYELIPYKTMLQRDLTTGKLVSSDQKLNVSVRKWDSKTNEGKNPLNNQGLYIHVDCEHIGTNTGHTTNVFSSVTNGEIELHLLNELNLKSIRLYLSNESSLSNAKTNYLTFEDIGVYANGEDGNEIEFLYYLTNEEKTPINPTPLNGKTNENYQVSEGTPSKYFVDANITTGQYASSDGTGIYITEAVAKKGTDDPGNVSATQRFQYVAMRKRVDGKGQAFFTPVIGSAYGEQGPIGPPGESAESTIITQLSNPSGTVMVVNGEFQSTTSESNLRALKGTEFGNITGVTITKITVNGTPVANDYVSVEHADDIINPYTEEKLLFTINPSKVDKTKEQTIEVTIQFTAFGKTFTEVKTILVRLAAENSCYLMLTDSNVSVAKDKALLSGDNQVNLTNTLNAVLFDGKTKAQGVEYSATFDSAKVKGSCNSSTGLISITAANPDYDTIEIPVTAKYRGGTYTATLRVSIDVAEWKLKTNLLMINPDHPTDIICSCLMNGEPIFEDLNVSAGGYRYKIDNGTGTSGQNITKNTFTISKDVAQTVTNQMTIEGHSFTVSSGINLLASQTIGILKDGVSGESAVHLELTQDSYNISLSKDSHENISQAVLYNGSTALTTGVTYTSSRASATSEKVTIDTSGNITLDKSTITSTESTPVNVTITATYNQKPYTKTFTLTKNAGDVWLSIDNVVINADDPKAITGRVMQNSSVFTKSNYYKLCYTLNGTGSEQSITSTDGTFTISLDIVKNATSSLEIYLGDSKGNLYDKESIGVVKNGIDGVNAQYYQIDANHILITKDSKGNVISPSEAITPKVCYINGAAKEDQDYNSLINEGYYIWKKLNGGTATKISNSTSLSTACSLVNTQLVYYLCKKTVTSNPETQFEDYVEIDVIQTEPEKSGPVIYPAGEWTSGTTYTGNVQKAPYVSVTDGDNVSYYIAYGSLSAKPTSDNTLASNVTLDGTNPTNRWVRMENYNAIYADIGVLKQALVGKWVFHGDYMFSQNGIGGYYTNNETKYRLYARGSLISGKSSSYSDVNTYTLDVTSMSNSTSITNYTTLVNNMSLGQKIENGVWIPKVCFNAKTGVGHVGSYTDDGVTYKGLQGDENSIKLGNNLKITNDGFIASDNLSNPTSYFKLSEWEAQNGDKSQYLSFQASNKSGFRTDSNNNFGLAVYGTNAYVDNTGHSGALTVIKGDSTYGLFVEGGSCIKGNLDVTGQLTTSDGTYTSSDERLKNFYDEIEVDLDSMSQINKKYFSYKDSDKVQIGVSAQEVQKLYPELVGENGGYLTVAYDKLSVIALKAIDVLHQDNLKLKAEIEELKKLIAQ